MAKELQYVKGIGPKRAEVLTRDGIMTEADVLEYYSYRYVDRSKIYAISELRADKIHLSIIVNCWSSSLCSVGLNLSISA